MTSLLGFVEFDALAVVEPYIYRHPYTGLPTIAQDRRWEVFRPMTTRPDGHARHAFRAAIWVNSRCRATQIQADSYDVAAVLVQLKRRRLLLVVVLRSSSSRHRSRKGAGPRSHAFDFENSDTEVTTRSREGAA